MRAALTSRMVSRSTTPASMWCLRAKRSSTPFARISSSAKCNRVLHADGHLLLTTPNVNSVASWLMMSMLNLPPYASARYRSPHVRDFTTRLLKLALRNNGFATIKIHGTWLGLPWPAAVEWFFGPVEAALAYGLPRIAAGLTVLARKVGPVRYDPAVEIQTTLV